MKKVNEQMISYEAPSVDILDLGEQLTISTLTQGSVDQGIGGGGNTEYENGTTTPASLS